MQTHSDLRPDFMHVLRAALVLAGAIAFACAVALVAAWEIRRYGDVLEDGPVELAQLVLLALSSAAFAVRCRSAREAAASGKPLALLSLTTLAMAVRELDGFFDASLFHGAWAVVDAFVLLAFFAVVFVGFRKTVSQTAGFISCRTYLVFLAGFVLAVAFSRLIGMKENWNAFLDFVPGDGADTINPLSGHSLRRCVKNAVEECSELAGYLAIFASAAVPPLLGRRRDAVSD